MVPPVVLAGLPAAISGVGSILGGVFGSNSAAEQNREERAWQEHMAATQYQRAVGDMKAAGLNPLMIYGKGGMSAPVAGGARMDESVGIREGVRGASGAAIQALGLLEMKARIADTNSAAALKMQEKDESLARTEAARTSASYQAWLEEKDRNLFLMDYGGKPLEFWQQNRVAQAENLVAESLARQGNMNAQAAEAMARKAFVELEKEMLEKKRSFADAWKAYWDQVGVYGAYFEVGGKLFQQVVSSLGVGAIGKALISPGQKSGGAASAKQAERMENVLEFNNNHSDMIGR